MRQPSLAGPSVASSATDFVFEATVASDPVERTLDLAPGTRVGEYVVEQKIGEGGMGAVFAATHPIIGKKAAIKVISPTLCADPSAVQRFVQEAKSVNRIGHIHIVDIFSFGELPDGRSYFVMEWLQGRSLAQRIAAGGLTLGESVEILDQVADALEAAHDKGIIHRDLKPDNVFLVDVRGGRQLVKLLDFGIAKLADPGNSVAMTRTGIMMGTPAYVSPEQARGKTVGPATDIYSLGVMAFEMVCGRLPFQAEGAMDMVMKHISEPPPRPSSLWPDIPASLETMILRMLEKEPERRPPLAEVRTCLSELRGSVASVPGSASAAYRIGGLTPPPVTPAGSPRVRSSAVVASPAATSPVATPPVGTLSEVARSGSRSFRRRLAWLGGAVLLATFGIAFVLALRGRTQSSNGPSMNSDRSPAARPEPVAAPVTPTEPVAPPVPVLSPTSGAPSPTTAAPVTPPVPIGEILVKVNTSRARIEVDDKVAADPANEARVSVFREGEHRVVVTAPGHLPFAQTVVVSAGTTAVVKATLKRESSDGEPRKAEPGNTTLRRDEEGKERKQPKNPKNPGKPLAPEHEDEVLNPFGQ